MANGSISKAHSRIISFSNTGSNDNGCLPDSICAKSKISLINSNKYQPPCKICLRLRCCEGVGIGLPDSINCAKPNMALSGVRNSWLMFDKNSDFAALAFSAMALASSMPSA